MTNWEGSGKNMNKNENSERGKSYGMLKTIEKCMWKEISKRAEDGKEKGQNRKKKLERTAEILRRGGEKVGWMTD